MLNIKIYKTTMRSKHKQKEIRALVRLDKRLSFISFLHTFTKYAFNKIDIKKYKNKNVNQQIDRK